jgi:hypothetical protein
VSLVVVALVWRLGNVQRINVLARVDAAVNLGLDVVTGPGTKVVVNQLVEVLVTVDGGENFLVPLVFDTGAVEGGVGDVGVLVRLQCRPGVSIRGCGTSEDDGAGFQANAP